MGDYVNPVILPPGVTGRATPGGGWGNDFWGGWGNDFWLSRSVLWIGNVAPKIKTTPTTNMKNTDNNADMICEIIKKTPNTQ